MNPLPVGSRIRVTGNTSSHSYRIGSIHRVHSIDDDGTFQAVDENGHVGKYIKWKDCEHAGIGWEWLRTQLDARSLDLLSAFDGIGQLSLKPDIEIQLALSIPQLDEAILGILPTMEEEASRYAATDKDHETEDDDDLDHIFGPT
jgi:hypothetical protein